MKDAQASNPVCPFCGGLIQATKKLYYTIEEVPVLQQHLNDPPNWTIYCQNDCAELSANVECEEIDLVSEVRLLIEQCKEEA